MNKIRTFVIPLLSVFSLIGCGKAPEPIPLVTHKFTFTGEHCTINGSRIFTHDIYENDKNIQYTIVPDATFSLPEQIKDVEFDKNTGVITIKEIKEDININVVASRVPIPGLKHKIYIEPNGGTLNDPSEKIQDADDGYPLDSAPAITREGYKASEITWFTDNEFNYPFIFGENGTKVYEDLVLYVKWGSIATNPVHFVETSMKTVDKDIDYGDRAIYYTPTQKGFIFKGWYKTDPETDPLAEKFIFSDPIKSETYIYAKWEVPDSETHNIKFNINNCNAMYKGNIVPSSGIDLVIPKNIDPYYIRFSIKSYDNIYLKPSKVSIMSGESLYQDYFFCKEDGGLCINVQSDLTITGDCDIYKTLEECSWNAIQAASKDGKAKDAFKVGDTKQVKLLNKEGGEQELPHTVRIIGFNKDVDIDNKQIGITFEFANLISDENGYSLASLWQDDADGEDCNFDYLNSTIRKNLTGYGNGNIMWYEKDSAIQSDRKKTVLDMLPNDLRSVLKIAKKQVNLKTTGSWIETDLTDELFLLSANEMNEKTDGAEVGEAYEYYKNAKPGLADPIRIKRQVKGAEGARTSAQLITGNAFGSGSSYAGYNSINADYGGYSWLRSPRTSGSDGAWLVGGDGGLNSGYVYGSAFAVAPAFCI